LKRHEALAQRRQLLAATATLQRARLAGEWHGLRTALRSGSRSATVAAATVGLATLALLPRGTAALSAAREPSLASAPLWASVALTLWRVARVWLQRQAAGATPRH
jgi:hypothetical protein